ncbi:MAG: hypothetical protein M1823_006903, partial [Watsoniomyces obsoletus]
MTVPPVNSNGYRDDNNRASTTIHSIIDGRDHLASDPERVHGLASGSSFHGVDVQACAKALESSAAAFKDWSQTSPQERRHLLLKLSNLLVDRGDEVKAMVEQEIHCSKLWAEINLLDSVALIEESAALVTSEVVNG